MKLIKFNLPLNGTSISTLEQLQNNLTAEIIDPFRSGKLCKWIQTRSLTEQTNKLEKLFNEDVEREIILLKNLYEVFGSKVDSIFLQAAIAERKKILPSSQYSVDNEIIKIKEDFSNKELAYQLEIQKLQQEAEATKAETEKKYTESEWTNARKDIFHSRIMATLTLVCMKSKTALFWCQSENKKFIATKEIESWFEGIDMEKIFEESEVINKI